jgi:glycerol-3-phosphate acyltransferase PlsY
MIWLVIIFILSFLCGSIPFGYLLVKKYRQIDIRDVGSGNIGSTNVKRVAGPKISLLTQIFDISKGTVPVLLVLVLVNNQNALYPKDYYSITAVFAAIMGHDFSPFLKFKGGKGVNTTLGAFLPLIPFPVILAGITFKLLKYFTPIVSIRSMTIGLLLPLYTYLLRYNNSLIIATLFAGLLILIMHAENIKRLFQKTEH